MKNSILFGTTDFLSVQRCFVYAQNSPSTVVHGCTTVEDGSNGHRIKKALPNVIDRAFCNSFYSYGTEQGYKESYFSAKSIVLVSSLQPVSKFALPRAFSAYILIASGDGSKYRITSRSLA